MKPENKKIAYWALGGIAALFVIPALLQKDRGGAEEDPTGNGGVPDASNGGYVFNARKVADELYRAMESWGTDEDAILASLKRVNQSQFGQVVTAFGRKQYNPFTGDQYDYNPFDGQLEFYGLASWLKSELSASSYNTLRNKYPNHL